MTTEQRALRPRPPLFLLVGAALSGLFLIGLVLTGVSSGSLNPVAHFLAGTTLVLLAMNYSKNPGIRLAFMVLVAVSALVNIVSLITTFAA